MYIYIYMTYTYTYVYLHMYICMYICVSASPSREGLFQIYYILLTRSHSLLYQNSRGVSIFFSPTSREGLLQITGAQACRGICASVFPGQGVKLGRG